MANDEPEDESENPARAFAELRAEVTILRRAVEGLPEVIHSIEAPDYGPSFGALVKAMNATEARLAAIESTSELTWGYCSATGLAQLTGGTEIANVTNKRNGGDYQWAGR